jgi:hypothetical protein
MSWVTFWVGDVNGLVSSSLLLGYVLAYTCSCGVESFDEVDGYAPDVHCF